MLLEKGLKYEGQDFLLTIALKNNHNKLVGQLLPNFPDYQLSYLEYLQCKEHAKENAQKNHSFKSYSLVFSTGIPENSDEEMSLLRSFDECLSYTENTLDTELVEALRERALTLFDHSSSIFLQKQWDFITGTHVFSDIFYILHESEVPPSEETIEWEALATTLFDTYLPDKDKLITTEFGEISIGVMQERLQMVFICLKNNGLGGDPAVSKDSEKRQEFYNRLINILRHLAVRINDPDFDQDMKESCLLELGRNFLHCSSRWIPAARSQYCLFYPPVYTTDNPDDTRENGLEEIQRCAADFRLACLEKVITQFFPKRDGHDINALNLLLGEDKAIPFWKEQLTDDSYRSIERYKKDKNKYLKAFDEYCTPFSFVAFLEERLQEKGAFSRETNLLVQQILTEELPLEEIQQIREEIKKKKSFIQGGFEGSLESLLTVSGKQLIDLNPLLDILYQSTEEITEEDQFEVNMEKLKRRLLIDPSYKEFSGLIYQHKELLRQIFDRKEDVEKLLSVFNQIHKRQQVDAWIFRYFGVRIADAATWIENGQSSDALFEKIIDASILEKQKENESIYFSNKGRNFFAAAKIIRYFNLLSTM